MSRYLIDKTFALLERAERDDNYWKEVAVTAVEALVDESAYAQERDSRWRL